MQTTSLLLFFALLLGVAQAQVTDSVLQGVTNIIDSSSDLGFGGAWGPWTAFGPCSLSCGFDGVQVRTRACKALMPCFGKSHQQRECPEPQPCPLEGELEQDVEVDQLPTPTTSTTVKMTTEQPTTTPTTSVYPTDAEMTTEEPITTTTPVGVMAVAVAPSVWSDWSEWGDCSASCGPGLRTRTRICPDEAVCPGLAELTSACPPPLPLCPPPFLFGQWSEWTDCSLSCGAGGTQSRQRSCTGDQCDVLTAILTNQTRACFVAACPIEPPTNVSTVAPAVWSEWAEWAECSVTCGAGIHRRSRNCTGGNEICPGVSSLTEACTLDVCPLPFVFGEWEEWSQCSVSCGVGGSQFRSRPCTGDQCDRQPSVLLNQTRVCPFVVCPTTTTTAAPITTTTAPWKKNITWSAWSDCSTTCDLGEQKRICTGVDCERSEEIRACNVRVCVGNVWQEWTQWTQCSVSCGVGGTTRARSCDGGACIGLAQERRVCIPSVCAFNPPFLFGQWTEWTACSTTCGVGGQQRRTRTCTGERCSVQPKVLVDATRPCFVRVCPSAASGTTSSVSEWSAWSDCNATCDAGYRTRERQCAQTDVSCAPDVLKEEELCNEQLCPVPKTQYNTFWSEWSDCSLDCGLGEMRRTRDADCTYCDTKEETVACSEGVCRSSWQEWSDWSPCSTTCGPGQEMRARGCTGNGCIGLSSQSRFCSELTVCPL